MWRRTRRRTDTEKQLFGKLTRILEGEKTDIKKNYHTRSIIKSIDKNAPRVLNSVRKYEFSTWISLVAPVQMYTTFHNRVVSHACFIV